MIARAYSIQYILFLETPTFSSLEKQVSYCASTLNFNIQFTTFNLNDNMILILIYKQVKLRRVGP